MVYILELIEKILDKFALYFMSDGGIHNAPIIFQNYLFTQNTQNILLKWNVCIEWFIVSHVKFYFDKYFIPRHFNFMFLFSLINSDEGFCYQIFQTKFLSLIFSHTKVPLIRIFNHSFSHPANHMSQQWYNTSNLNLFQPWMTLSIIFETKKNEKN